MAIEDAIVLAKCLRDLPDTERAFAAFEQLRRPRVERIVGHRARSSITKAPARSLGLVVRLPHRLGRPHRRRGAGGVTSPCA